MTLCFIQPRNIAPKSHLRTGCSIIKNQLPFLLKIKTSVISGCRFQSPLLKFPSTMVFSHKKSLGEVHFKHLYQVIFIAKSNFGIKLKKVFCLSIKQIYYKREYFFIVFWGTIICLSFCLFVLILRFIP